MKRIISIFAATVMLLSCNVPKTVYISNKTGSPIGLVVDSSYQRCHPSSFADSINGLRIVKKKVLDFGPGKWIKEDKSRLEELVKHTKMVREEGGSAINLPGGTKVSLISFNVEELWLNINEH